MSQVRNTSETVLNLRDADADVEDVAFDAQAEDSTALSLPGTAKVRAKDGALEASVDGSAWGPISVGGGGAVSNRTLGILPSNSAAENSEAWDAAMDAIPVGAAVWWMFEAGTFQFQRTIEVRREVRISGVGGLGEGGTLFRWNSGNMCGVWFRGSDVGSAAGSYMENIRVSSGGLAAYTDGRTATSDGSNVITLNDISPELRVGRWITVNGVTAYITSDDSPASLTRTLSEVVPAAVGSAIAFAPTYGLYCNARIRAENIFIPGNFTSGFYCYGNVAALTDASSSLFTKCTAVACVNGFECGGPDGNNITFLGCSASVNTAWGYTDFSFLGNTYVGCHAENNADAFRTTGVTAESTYVGCYCEAGQNIDIAGQCYWLGGTVGDGISAFVGAGIAHTSAGYAVGNALNNVFFNGAGSSGYVQIGGNRADDQMGKFKTPNSDGAEEFVDRWNASGQLFTFTAGRHCWAGAGSGSEYITGLYSRNTFFGPSSKVSFPCSQIPRHWYWGYQRQMRTDAQVASRTLPAEITNELGTGYPIQVGDTFIESRPAAGEISGWKCLTAGTSGTYTDGRTATGDGTTTFILSGANSQLEVGQWVTVGATVSYITAIAGLNVTLNSTVAVGAGQAISFTAPTFAQLGRLSGGAGSSVASPGNATLNTVKGRSAIAAGAAAVTITNALVTATSIINATLQTVDGTLTAILSVVPGAGSFVITGNANATGNVNVAWSIVE